MVVYSLIIPAVDVYCKTSTRSRCMHISPLLNATHKTTCDAYTSSHRIIYPSSVAAKRIKRLPGSRKQSVKRLNVGLVHAAQAGRIDRERPHRETHPQDCLSSHGNTLEQSWRMIVLLRCSGRSGMPCYAGFGLPKLEMRQMVYRL